MPSDKPTTSTTAPLNDARTLATLFELGSKLSSVLDLDQLLRRIVDLTRRLIDYEIFAVYLLDERTHELCIAHAVGYSDEMIRTLRLPVGKGLVGAAVESGEPLLAGDVRSDPRYIDAVPSVRSELVVPLLRKGNVIGALNLQSAQPDYFTEEHVRLLRLFGTHIAVAIENARLFERERQYAETLETLAEIGHEIASILDPDLVLQKVAGLVKRVTQYRTFGIMLLDEAKQELVMKVAIRYGPGAEKVRVPLGVGLVGRAARDRRPILVPDVTKDPRYIEGAPDVRSELVIPMLYKDRVLGVFDLESPELDAFTEEHVKILTPLASYVAVALENGRLYEALAEKDARLERELRFAQVVQMGLLPSELPRKIRGIEVAAKFTPASELGGDFYDFLSTDPSTLVVVAGDVSGHGVAAALYGAFAGELVRSRTFRRRFTPATLLQSVNTILRERALGENNYCTLCYTTFDLKKRIVTLANSGFPYPLRNREGECRPVEIPGLPLGAFDGSTYEEVAFDLKPGDIFVYYSDGVCEARNPGQQEFGVPRIATAVEEMRGLTAQGIVDELFRRVQLWCGGRPPTDDITVVVVRITDLPGSHPRGADRRAET